MGKVFRALGWVAAAVLLVGVVLRAGFVDVWTLPDEPRVSAAVAPSLAGGDTILYMFRNKPAFGDLVRCKDPDDATRFVVGRVVGLQGDTVEVNGGELRVGGKRYLGEMACAESKIEIPTRPPARPWRSSATSTRSQGTRPSAAWRPRR